MLLGEYLLYLLLIFGSIALALLVAVRPLRGVHQAAISTCEVL